MSGATVASPGVRSRERGMTLVEVMVAAAVAIVGVLGGTLAVFGSARLQRQTREYGDAMQVARAVYEDFRAGDLAVRFQDYRSRSPYTVEGMDVEVHFPERLLVESLGQVPPGAEFVDLDQDGEVDIDPSATARSSLLPVEVTVTGVGGQRMVCSFLVTDR